RVLRAYQLAITLIVSFALLGSSAYDVQEDHLRRLAMTSAGYGFDLVSWELSAISRKIAAAFASPAAELSPGERKARVLTYVETTQELDRTEYELARHYAQGDRTSAEAQQLEAKALA